jgi:hypothetical protein
MDEPKADHSTVSATSTTHDLLMIQGRLLPIECQLLIASY